MEMTATGVFHFEVALARLNYAKAKKERGEEFTGYPEERRQVPREVLETDCRLLRRQAG